MGRKKAKAGKKTSFIVSKKEDEKLSSAPHSMVVYRGQVGPNVADLTMDMRRMLEPYTASKIQLQKHNVMKDLKDIAGSFSVNRILSFQKTQTGLNFRVAGLPHGPTLYFRVKKYALCRDVASSLKRPQTSEHQYKNPPLVVLHNFPEKNKDIDHIDSKHKLAADMLKNTFPKITVGDVDLNNVKRCVEFSMTEDRELIEMRHYSIAVRPVGISRRMKKIVSKKVVPNLNRFDDVGEYLMNQGDGSASESEAEPDEKSKVELPQKMTGSGNMKNHQSAVRLTELGPRLTLELIKIEDGFCEGKVLYHKLMSKTEAEVKQLEQARLNKIKEKEYRKKVQEQNVKRKEEQKKLNKEKSIEGQKRKHQTEEGEETDVATNKRAKHSNDAKRSDPKNSKNKNAKFGKASSKKPSKNSSKSFFKKSKKMSRK